jgi:hypothetical protein
MPEDKNSPIPTRYHESMIVKTPSLDKHIFEESEKELPLVIFPEIRAITANWVTKNYTYYPAESLIGNPSLGTGLVSFTHPYNIPIIRDHNSGGGMFGGEAAVPYGRVYSAEFVTSDTGGSYVRAIPAITDDWAINMVMSGRFLTVSIGTETSSVNCSICLAEGHNINMIEDGRCDHNRGEKYDGQTCVWVIGPVKAQEISFVNVPADVNAGVITRNLDIAEVRAMVGGAESQYLLDMATGAKESVDTYCANRLNISRRTYNGILTQARKRKEEGGQIHRLCNTFTSGTFPLRDYVKGL